MDMKKQCSHGEVKFLGEEKGDKGINKYYRCIKCGNIFILSDEGNLYQILKDKNSARK